MDRDLILTCDTGTTGCKCTVFDTEGKTVSSVRRSYGTTYPKPHWSEQEANTIVEAVYSGIRELLLQVDPHRIACVGLSGHMNGCIAVDASGNVLHPNIIHSDCRSEEQVAEISKIIPLEDFYRLTGNRLDAHYTLPKVLWIKQNLPEVYKRTRWWLNIKDYIYGRLTGRFGYTDYSDASLTIALDIHKRSWAEELIRDCGLSVSCMPEIRPGHDVHGKITRDVYRLTGLMPGTPVAIGGGDGACCARGAGVSGVGDTYTYIGSSAWVSQLLEHPAMDPQNRILNILDVDGRSCYSCGTVQCACAAFNWAIENFTGDKHASGMDISRFENMARQIQPGAEGVMFLPTLMGWRTPYWDANTRGCLLGFTLYHDKRHIARAVYEGVAYALNSCAKIIAECGTPIRSMMLAGGGARSGLWPDMMAAIYGVPTRVHQNPGETTSLGAAIAAGVGVGLYSGYEQASELVRVRSNHNVNPQWHSVYEKYYPLYAQIYEQLRPISHGIAGIKTGD